MLKCCVTYVSKLCEQVAKMLKWLKCARHATDTTGQLIYYTLNYFGRSEIPGIILMRIFSWNCLESRPGVERLEWFCDFFRARGLPHIFAWHTPIICSRAYGLGPLPVAHTNFLALVISNFLLKYRRVVSQDEPAIPSRENRSTPNPASRNDLQY
jgi:hypothetical protein